MQATAKVQGVEPHFDPTYFPSTADQALFDQQNGYNYKVLMDVVKDPSLKAELNKVPVGDGQQRWAAMDQEEGLRIHCHRAAADKLIATINKHVTTDNQGIGIRGDNGMHSRYNGVDIQQTRDYVKLSCSTYIK
jgi:hypothetical protein